MGRNLSLVNTDAAFLGENDQCYAGYAVSGAGDVNGDGYDDLLIGAHYNNEAASQAGQSYLILGRGNANWGHC
ncbi:MAG: hypothetical protein FJ026_17010, partial [Chloroflexi bacterium]|nr:hypothetical protein [Chloroflexota bacterium]